MVLGIFSIRVGTVPAVVGMVSGIGFTASYILSTVYFGGERWCFVACGVASLLASAFELLRLSGRIGAVVAPKRGVSPQLWVQFLIPLLGLLMAFEDVSLAVGYASAPRGLEIVIVTVHACVAPVAPSKRRRSRSPGTVMKRLT